MLTRGSPGVMKKIGQILEQNVYKHFKPRMELKASIPLSAATMTQSKNLKFLHFKMNDMEVCKERNKTKKHPNQTHRESSCLLAK